MARISDLVLRYLDRDAGSSEGSPTQYTCSGGTVRTAISAALSGLTDAAMRGGLMRWDVGLNATAHKWSAVKSYDDPTTTITMDTDLPNAVVATDKFTLIRGGRWLTDQRIPGLTPNGYDYTPTNFTGVEIDYVAMLNNAGNGILNYNSADGTAQWTPPGGTIGPSVVITSLSLGMTATLVGGGVSVEEKSKFIVLTRDANPLPVGNTSDTIALTIPKGIHMMPLTGTETQSGVTIYRPVGIINTHATDTIYALKSYVPNPFTGSAQSTVKVGSGGIGTGADTLEITNPANWPTHGWIAKVDGSGVVLDCRYCYDRSGDTMTVMNPAGGQRGFTAASWAEGDNIVPMPWQDIGFDAPSASEFENPNTESTAPTGITFSAPMSADNAISAGDLAAGGIYCVWERFVVPANMRPMSNLVADLRVYAEVDEE